MMEEVDLADTPLAMRPQLQSQDSATADDEEPPDPRIQIELERLNTSTDLINKLEVDLDEARMMFRQTLVESTQQIDNLTKKLGKCVEQARPYYEARIKAKQALTEAQKSAVRYERAVSQHSAAREMVQLAEEGLLARGCIFDSTWQEMLNHATTKVNDAEREKIESASEHKDKSNKYHESETRVKYLQKELKRSIAKSSLNARRSLLQLSNIIRMQELQLLPYFELKAAVNQRLEEQKRHVRELEAAVASAKANYSQALSNLETISDQIHKTRQSRVDLGIRGVGVGAESPGPPFCTKNENEIAKEKSTNGHSTKSASKKVIEKETAANTSEQTIPPRSTSCANPAAVSTTISSTSSPLLVSAVNSGDTSTTANEAKSAVLVKGVEGPLSAINVEPNDYSTNSDEVSPSVSTTPNRTADKSRDDAGGEIPQPQPKTAKNGEETALGAEAPNVGDAADSQTSYLSGWQFVALPNIPPTTNQNLLSIEDRESIVSDSESLTSIEMLSEEAIANLMLEDEINEATHSICSPHFTEEYLAPPVPKAGAPLPFIPGVTKRKEDDQEIPEGERREMKNASQASSSDSGEPWEVVIDAHEPPEEKRGLDPHSREEVNDDDDDDRAEDQKKAVPSSASWDLKTSELVSVGKERHAVGKCRSEAPIAGGTPLSDEVSISSVAMETSRPLSLPVYSFYSKSLSSGSSPSSTSNSLSEEFSPSYAPLSDTPELEASGNAQQEVEQSTTENTQQLHDKR